jgi:hypothetical protein
MPRKSPDAIWGEQFRASKAPPPPPRPKPPAYLRGRARQAWEEIVAEKPHDYFDAPNRILLEGLCIHLHIVDAVWPELDKLDLSNPKDLRRYRALSTMLARQSALSSMLMTKLRLLPTKHMAKRAAELNGSAVGTPWPWERHV